MDLAGAKPRHGDALHPAAHVMPLGRMEFANGVRRSLLPGDDFRDVGCTLKAWRREVALRIPKFHGFHRFIPILARSEGYKVVEVDVSHRAREHGQTHYGNLGRAISGFRDLLGVRWLLKRRRSVSGARAAVDR